MTDKDSIMNIPEKINKVKKLLVKIVVVSFLIAGFSTSAFAAKCTGITMSDTKGVAGGK